MATPGGTITRKDIIEDDALKVGDLYVAEMNKMIGANKVFAASILEYGQNLNNIRKVENNQQFLTEKQKEIVLFTQAKNAIELQKNAEIALDKIKQESIKTDKISLDLDIIKAKAKKEISVILVEDEKLNQQKIKTQKEQAILEQQLNKLSIDREKLQKENLQSNKALIQVLIEEERLKKEQLSIVQKENLLIQQQQSISKNSLDIKSKELRIIAQEEAAKKRNTVLTVEERVQNEINNKILKQEALERLGLVSEYTKLNNERAKAKNILRDLIATEGSSTAEIKKARIEFELLDKKVKLADQSVGDFTKNVGNYKSAFASISSIGKGLIGAFGITTGSAAIGALFKDAYESMKQFEQGVADLSSITGASGKDLEYLKNQAIDLGNKTKGGAIAVVEAYKLIASAKPELLEDVKALNMVTEATLTLAQAAGIEMPEAATALTDAMNQFGAGAERSQEFIDALANGAKYGSAEIPGLTESLLKFGAVSRSTNVSIKESVALVELLAENGLKGADAGTALRNVMLKISAPDALPKKAQEALHSLGIEFSVLKDKNVSFQEKIELLKPLLNDNAKLVKVFGLENIVAAQNVIEHSDRLKELTSKMGEFGTAQEQADIRMNTLQGDTEIMTSTYDSFILSLASGSGVVSDFFRFFVQGTTNALNGLIRLNSSWDELFEKAQSDGAKNGVKLFNERFNSLIGDNLSDVQRQKIRDRIKEINAEIAKGNKDKNLQGEKTDLFKMLGTGDDLEVSLSIAKTAYNEAKILEAKIADINKKIREDSSFGAIGSDGETRLTTVGLKEDKERLIKALAEQNAIIQENNKKVQASRIKVDPNETNTSLTPPDGDGETDAEKKKRLAAAKKAAQDKLDLEKQLADSLYELQKQRLEQTIKFNDEISKDDEQSDEVRVQATLNNQQKQFELLLLTKNHLLDNDKLTADDRIRIEEDYSAKKIEISKKTALEIDKINEFDFAKYQAEIDAKVKDEQTFANNEEARENARFNNELSTLEGDQKAIQEATKRHEEELWTIKHASAVRIAQIQFDNLQTELEAFKKQSDGSKESTKIIADLELKLSEYKKRLSELGLENFKDSKEKEVKTTKEKTEEVLEISSQMLGDLANLSNAFSEAKIAKIDDEINKNNEYYDNQIVLAGKDEKQKDLLEKERAKKNAILEKKKAEEKNKQAKIDKAVTIAQIAIATALAIIKAAPNPALVALSAITGAIALATAIATPIPKYKDGRKDGPAEIAMINDGGVQEVVTDASGENARTTTIKNAIVPLKQHDIVHKSFEDYQRYIKNALLNNVVNQGKKMNAYQQSVINDVYSGKMLSKLDNVEKAIKNQKHNIILNAPKIDIEHAIWASKNKSW